MNVPTRVPDAASPHEAVARGLFESPLWLTWCGTDYSIVNDAGIVARHHAATVALQSLDAAGYAVVLKSAIDAARKALMAAGLLAEGYGKQRTAAFFDETRDELEPEPVTRTATDGVG